MTTNSYVSYIITLAMGFYFVSHENVETVLKLELGKVFVIALVNRKLAPLTQAKLLEA